MLDGDGQPLRSLRRLEPIPIVEAELLRIERRIVDDEQVRVGHLVEEPEIGQVVWLVDRDDHSAALGSGDTRWDVAVACNKVLDKPSGSGRTRCDESPSLSLLADCRGKEECRSAEQVEPVPPSRPGTVLPLTTADAEDGDATHDGSKAPRAVPPPDGGV